MRMVGANCDVVHYGSLSSSGPGCERTRWAAFGMEKLYSIPGVEEVEDGIVSSGPKRLAEHAKSLRSADQARRAGDH